MHHRTIVSPALLALCVGIDTGLGSGCRQVNAREMKLGQPLLTTEMSGSVGGLTTAKARGGLLYARSRVRPSNPRSFAQSTMRLVLAGLAAGWGSMNDAQRAGWTNLARDSESGIDAFVRANFNPRLVGNDVTFDAPVSIALDSVPYTGVTVDASDHKVTLSAAVPADENVNVYVSRKQLSTRGAQQYPFTFVGTIVAGATFMTLTSLQNGFNAVAGDIVYVRIVAFGTFDGDHSAQVAPAQEFRIVVQA